MTLAVTSSPALMGWSLDLGLRDPKYDYEVKSSGGQYTVRVKMTVDLILRSWSL